MLDFRKTCNRHISTDERFENQVYMCPISGCWIWAGCESSNYKYGRFSVDGKQYAAHRYSWIKHFGEIPKGMLVLHKCDTPSCVNPNHLFLGTNQDNSDDKVRKNRQAKGKKLSLAQGNQKRRGEKNGNAKLTDGQVKEIIMLDLPQRKIAQMFNVTQANIWRIKNDAKLRQPK